MLISIGPPATLTITLPLIASKAPPDTVVTVWSVPPEARASSKPRVYSPITAPPKAESRIVTVHSLDEPVAGTDGENSTRIFSDLPRLSKYSTDNWRKSPSDPASVSVAGRLTPKLILVVGSPVN